MKRGFSSLVVLILLFGNLSVTLGNETLVRVNIEKSGEGFQVVLFLDEGVSLSVDFTKDADKIFAKDFLFQLVDQSIPDAPYRSMLKGNELETVYVNEQNYAVVVIVQLETGKYTLRGIIGDMVISYVQPKNGHYFLSSTLKEYNPKRSFQEFDQYLLLKYSFPKAEIRLLVVLDAPLYQTLLKRHPTENQIKVYLSVILNTVKMRLRITTRNTINLVISRVIALEDSNLFSKSSVMMRTLGGVAMVPTYNAEETLGALAVWLCHKSTKGDHNLATLLTDREFVEEISGNTVSGISYTKGAGVLDTTESGSTLYGGATIVHHGRNFDSLHVLVHEMMHSLSCEHEYDDKNALMADGTENTSVSFSLSEQNWNTLQEFLESEPGKHFKPSADCKMLDENKSKS